MPRGKYVNHKGRNRHFTNPEELERERREEALKQWRKKKDNIESEDSDEDEEGQEKEEAAGASGGKTKAASGDSESSSESESDDDGTKKKKGVEGMIEIENPNRIVKKQKKVTKLVEPVEGGDAADTKPELSRREREELEKQKARAHYQKLHAEGKTDEARADLARLALIRKQREDAAKKREEEKQAKEAMKAAKVEATGKALGKKT